MTITRVRKEKYRGLYLHPPCALGKSGCRINLQICKLTNVHAREANRIVSAETFFLGLERPRARGKSVDFFQLDFSYSPPRVHASELVQNFAQVDPECVVGTSGQLQGSCCKFRPIDRDLNQANLWKIFHKSNLGALLELLANWPQVAGTSGEFTGSQLRKNFCEVAWERSLCELRHHGDEVSPRPRE